jgi:hypothetical protein
MVFNVTFNNTSVMSWWHLYHIILHRVYPARAVFKLITLVVIGTDCIGSCKLNYHVILNSTAPFTILNDNHLFIINYFINYDHRKQPFLN